MKAELDPRAAGAPRRLQIVPMRSDDLRAVLRIETQSFNTSWPPSAFTSELNDNKLAHYVVGRLFNPRIGSDEIVGYGGIWVILEDSHITTLAVDPARRGHRYGEQLLVYLIRQAQHRGAAWMTLEVRESNTVAQALYRKYGFTVVSTRHGYYSDNNENALVMWAGNLRGELYQNRVAALADALEASLATGER